MDIHEGSVRSGFVVRRAVRVELLDSLALELEHEGTGLRVLHVRNDDVENLFSIVVPTLPPDDTGVAHILEHSVLFGSRKYPGREGVFELFKRSVGTFINAMTASDHTLFPVASTVPKDLFNLADVYWDAVFDPLLTEHTFRREGHRLEFANQADRSSPLVIRGIVHSEMLGGYSASEALVHRAVGMGLHSESAYGRDAGGDPERIPSLTHEALRAFHRSHYQLSQALVVVYGNIPTEDYLAFLSERLRDRVAHGAAISVQRQPRWPKPRVSHITCPVAPADAQKSWLALGWLVGDGLDLLDSMELRLLWELLVGHPGAVLRKALLDAKLGDDLAVTHLGEGLDTSAVVGVRGARAEQADEFVMVVLQTLQTLVDRRIERRAIETACQQLAYSTLEINELFPVHLLFRISTQYARGGDPLSMLHSAEHLRTVRDRVLADPLRLSALVRERWLENPHRLLVVAEGDPDYVRKRQDALAAGLRARKAAMTETDLDQLVAEAEAFDRLEAHSDVAAFDRLPALGIGDLPKRVRRIPTVFEREGRLDFLDNRVFANGINYLHLDLDLSHLPSDWLAYVGLFCQCLQKVGTRGVPWAETAARVAACTSGVAAWAQLDTHGTRPSHTIRSLRLMTSFLDGKAEQALGQLEALLFDLDVEDRIRLGEVVSQARAQQRAELAWRAPELARLRAGRPFGPSAWLTDEGHGLGQIGLVERLAAEFEAQRDEAMDETVAKLARIRDSLAGTPLLAASFTGSASERHAVRCRLTSWVNRAPAAPATAIAWNAPAWPARTGLAAPLNVACCAYLVPAPSYSDPAAAPLQVAATYYTLHYLVDEIRLRGAAYGAWCSANPFQGYLQLSSYQDPQIARTLDVFRKAASEVAKLGWAQSEIERMALVTASDALKPNRPGDATNAALWWHVHGLTDEVRQADYEALLSVGPGDARRAFLQALEQGVSRSSVCVVSSRAKLDEANAELGEAALSIDDVFGRESR